MTRSRPNQPRPGEIPYKAWKAQEAQRRSVTPKHIANLLWKGLLEPPPRRVVNRRVMFVRTNL